jgi:hypothetical protein
MDQAGKASTAHDGDRIINKHIASPPPANCPMAITETMSPNKKTLNFHAGACLQMQIDADTMLWHGSSTVPPHVQLCTMH